MKNVYTFLLFFLGILLPWIEFGESTKGDAAYMDGDSISAVYEIVDSLHHKDLFAAILSPFYMNPTYLETNDTLLSGNRILYICANNKEYVYDNVICNNLSGYMVDCERIKPYKGGVVLYRELGQGCKFSYEIYIQYLGDKEMYISQIKLLSECPNIKYKKQKRMKYGKSFPLSLYRRDMIEELKQRYGM